MLRRTEGRAARGGLERHAPMITTSTGSFLLGEEDKEAEEAEEGGVPSTPPARLLTASQPRGTGEQTNLSDSFTCPSGGRLEDLLLQSSEKDSYPAFFTRIIQTPPVGGHKCSPCSLLAH